ncbi:MAG: hypothetical protein M3Q71_02190 [Chloroflexota bacterium]|nr:hypothetical protein [Chloroflexota bacterium]
MAVEHQHTPPSAVDVDEQSIPAELARRRQWVAWGWKWTGRDEKPWTKVPINPHTGKNASSTDPQTWSTLATALARAETDDLAGIGYVFAGDDPYSGVDLDGCRNPNTGHLKSWATDIIGDLDSYTELSPSENGVHVIVRGTLPASFKTAAVEAYSQGRYFTITGHRLEGTPATINERTDALAALHQRFTEGRAGGKGEQEKSSPNGRRPSAHLSDQELLIKALGATNGPKVAQLYRGDTSGYASDSEADLALCSCFAFYTPDPEQIDRMFRASGLWRPKWDEQRGEQTYGARTITAALTGRTDFYQPPGTRLHVYKGGRTNEQATGGSGGGGGNGSSGTSAEHTADQEPSPDDTDDTRPAINAADQNLERISAKAWDALRQRNNPPRLFRFGGVPVRVDTPDGDAVSFAETLTDDRLGHELARAAIWFKETEREGQKSASPPTRMIRDMLAAPSSSYPLPPLLSIVQTPVFAPDGSLHADPGYHPAGRTFYAPDPGFVVPPVPERPSREEIRRAKSLILDELLGEFPFVGDAERANTVALVLDPYVRNLIDGPTPLRLIEAPTPGSGKGLLADVVLRPAVGRRITVMPAASDDAEWRKRITAQLSLAPAAILIDNITNALDSGALSSALTATWWTDRRLGFTEMVSMPVRCVWIGTANNPTMSMELARRTVRIRLDPQMDRPWQRSGFRHNDLRTWVDESRADLVWAALVLGRAWVSAGAPLSTIRLGSFERWAAVLGGILEVVGIDGFLGNLEEFYETADVEGAVWRAFVALWAEQHGETEVGVADLFTLAQTVDGFDFGKGSDRSQRTSFGKQLTNKRDQVIGEYRIAHTRTVQRAKRWRLIRTRPAESHTSTHHGEPREHQGTSQPPTYAGGSKQDFYTGAEMFTEVHDVHMDCGNAGDDPEEGEEIF